MDEKSEHIIRAEHFKAGWESGEEAERERIIALLEAEKCSNGQCMSDPCRNCEMPISDAIALIKGENE